MIFFLQFYAVIELTRLLRYYGELTKTAIFVRLTSPVIRQRAKRLPSPRPTTTVTPTRLYAAHYSSLSPLACRRPTPTTDPAWRHQTGMTSQATHDDCVTWYRSSWTKVSPGSGSASRAVSSHWPETSQSQSREYLDVWRAAIHVCFVLFSSRELQFYL